MASPFSADEIIRKLREDRSERVFGPAWTFVTTKTIPCAKCKREIKPGQKVAVYYKGSLAQFFHA